MYKVSTKRAKPEQCIKNFAGLSMYVFTSAFLPLFIAFIIIMYLLLTFPV